ncbi:hypothetical protein AMECASPLE_016508 [Ameca splendens]|uniref:Uncharacterized protein n=1 Tax=Ameca splendens TaxID=208324 RepID=A0ABV1A100_9TELE
MLIVRPTCHCGVFIEKERTQRRTLSCECFGNQPLSFDEVIKCDEKQLNTSETFCLHQASPLLSTAATSGLFGARAAGLKKDGGSRWMCSSWFVLHVSPWSSAWI